MSILPSQNLGSTSSSTSQRSSPNSNFNHGSFSPERQNYSASAYRSLRISDDAASSSYASDSFSGPVASAADDSEGSSQKVNEWETPSAENSLAHQYGGKNLQHQATDHAGVALAENQGKLSASPNTHQSSGSTGSRGRSMHSAGRKAHMVSGNHLLNFHYDPISRSQHRPRAQPPRRHQRRKPYNKDLFLQANFKFFVLDSGNYAAESMDPDKMLQWEDIICVKYSSPFQVQCPICLEDPLCPQITSCGHIFCFPCIMQYLMLGEDDCKSEYSKKCPLCFMMMSSKDFYTIYIENVKQHHVGDALEFVLLTRQKDSFVLSNRNCKDLNENNEIQDSFSKFIFTLDVDLSFREAMSDLDSWLARADSGLVDDLEKLPYVCAAIKQLDQRKKYWNGRKVSSGCKAHGSPDNATLCYIEHDADEFLGANSSDCVGDKSVWSEKSPPDRAQTSAAELFDDNHGILSSSFDDNKDIRAHFNGFGDGKDRDSYNFYQAIDGQHLILHPLNMKCLLHHYGHYDKLPSRISGKILQLESITQSEEMRRRYRYLSHFSLTTTFQFCEIDLSDSLPTEALSPFMDEIKNREKQRKQLARKEHREKKKAEAVGLHFMPIPVSLEQTSYDEPPTFSMDDFEALGSSTATSSSPPNIGERQLFSNVARLGFAAGHDSPALKPKETHSLPKMETLRDSFALTGPRNNGTPSFASITSRGKPPERPDTPKMNEMGKKGKKQSRVLLSTAGGRRY